MGSRGRDKDLKYIKSMDSCFIQISCEPTKCGVFSKIKVGNFQKQSLKF